MEERPHCNSISTLAVNVENLWSAMDRLKLKVMARKDENNKLHADNADLTTRVEELEKKPRPTYSEISDYVDDKMNQGDPK